MSGETSGSHGGEYEDEFWDVALCSLVKIDRRFTAASGLLVALMMEAVSTSETSDNFYETTQCNIPEDIFEHVSLWLLARDFLPIRTASRFFQDDHCPLPIPSS
jgi:hypothetical protein